jgi:hypothetical protein
MQSRSEGALAFSPTAIRHRPLIISKVSDMQVELLRLAQAMAESYGLAQVITMAMAWLWGPRAMA